MNLLDNFYCKQSFKINSTSKMNASNVHEHSFDFNKDNYNSNLYLRNVDLIFHIAYFTK